MTTNHKIPVTFTGFTIDRASYALSKMDIADGRGLRFRGEWRSRRYCLVSVSRVPMNGLVKNADYDNGYIDLGPQMSAPQLMHALKRFGIEIMTRARREFDYVNIASPENGVHLTSRFSYDAACGLIGAALGDIVDHPITCPKCLAIENKFRNDVVFTGAH